MKRMVIATLLAACSGPAAEPPPTHQSHVSLPPAHEQAQVVIAPPPPQPMVEQMIGELVLGHPRVAPYLHVTGNVPLTVWSIPELAQGAPLMRAGGRSVSVVEHEADARFRFTAYEPLGSSARVRVRFEIPAEGVHGYVDVELRDNVWSAVGVDVVER
jgi:hypothetical protein